MAGTGRPGTGHAELSELLAAYSLDALPDEEVALVEEHLASCPRCRAELASLHEVAGLLGNAGANAPAGTWDRIAADLALPPSGASPSARLRVLAGRRGKPAWRAAALAVAAALMAVLGVLSYRVVSLDNRVGQLQSALGEHGTGQLVALALADPAHRSIALTAEKSSLHARVVVLPDGQAYWVDDNLAALPAGSTYQLWALSAGKVVSLGVLGPAPHDVAFLVAASMTELMVTAEPAGGTPVPTTPVLVSGALAV